MPGQNSAQDLVQRVLELPDVDAQKQYLERHIDLLDDRVAQAFKNQAARLLRVDLHRYPDYTWLIVSRFFILLGIYAVQGFVQYYIRDRLGMPNPAEVTGNLLATIGLALTALVFPAGTWST